MRCINEIASEKSIAELNRRTPSPGPSCRQTSRFLIQKQLVSTRRSSTETSKKKSLYPRRSCTTRETFSHGQTGCVDTTPNLRTLRTPAHVILSRVAQELESSSQQESLRLAKQSSSHRAQHVARALVVGFLHTRALLHFPHALQSDLLSDHLPDLRCCPLYMEKYFARIHRMFLSPSPPSWLNRTRTQVMSPKISLNRTPPYWSNRCSSTDREKLRLAILLRALRLSLMCRIWTMSKFVLCWLHHFTYRREKQVPTDHEFVTPSEKTQC